MREFDALCLEPIPQYDSEKIRALRDHLQVSQAVLAAVLGANARETEARQLARSVPGDVVTSQEIELIAPYRTGEN